MAWLEDKKVGDAGEAYVADLARRRNHTVEDLTNIPYFWSKDIDFKIDDIYVEVKTDRVMNKTGNIWLEDTIEWLERGCVDKGWWRKTEADYIFYLNGVSYDLYIYAKKDLEDYVATHKVNKTFAQDRVQFREGFCIPVKAVPHQFIKGNVC